MGVCAVCGKEFCDHGSLTIREGKYIRCDDCREEWVGKVVRYSVPMKDGKIDLTSETYFPCCKECYWE